MVSLSAVDARVSGAGAGQLSSAPLSHAGVYRLAKVEGLKPAGVSGMLFLREDRSCVLRLVLPGDEEKKVIRLMRGIWWPVPVGVKTLTSDGCVGVWPAKRNSVVVRLPMRAPGDEGSTLITNVKFVRVR